MFFLFPPPYPSLVFFLLTVSLLYCVHLCVQSGPGCSSPSIHTYISLFVVVVVVGCWLCTKGEGEEGGREEGGRRIGLYESFRQPRGKTEGPQHFAFPEISRENRGCLVLHSVSLEFPSLGKLASFPESESWSGAKSGAKLRKSARYPGIFQVYRGFPGIPAKYPVFCRFWPQNSLRHGSEPPQNDEFHGVSPGFPEETRGCCRETSRKHGKETR